MYGTVFIPPINVLLFLRRPETAIMDRLVEVIFQLLCHCRIIISLCLISQNPFTAGPQIKGFIHLGIYKRILEASPDDIQPIACPLFFYRVIHHLKNAVAIRIPSDQPIQCLLATCFMRFQPFDITTQVKLFRRVNHMAGLRIYRVSPSCFIISGFIIECSRHLIFIRIMTPGKDTSVGCYRIIPLTV